jgi:hypothetical protein
MFLGLAMFGLPCKGCLSVIGSYLSIPTISFIFRIR